MGQPKKWWYGLIPVLLAWFFVSWWQMRPIEAQVSRRVDARIAEDSLLNRRIVVRGRDVRLSGSATGIETPKAIQREARQARGVRKARLAVAPLTVIAPARWMLLKTNAGIALSGGVSDPVARRRIVGAVQAANPGISVADQMTYAGGIPKSFLTIVQAAPEISGLLKAGSLEIIDGSVRLKGEAAGFSQYGLIQERIQGLGQSARIVERDIAPPTVSPYVWKAIKTGDRLSITGYVPSLDAKKKAVAALAQAAPKLAIDDRVQIASGAPADFADRIGFGLAQLVRLDDGSVALRDGALEIRGDAPTVEAYQAMEKAFATGHGAAGEAKLLIRPPERAPFSLAMRRDASGIRVSGFTPSLGLEARIAQALAGSGSVVWSLQPARGQSDHFDEAALLGAKLLALSSDAELAVSNDALSGIGSARDADSYAMAKGLLANVPRGVSAVGVQIGAPLIRDFSWSARRDPDSLTLSGFVSDDETRRALIAQARRVAPQATVVDAMSLGVGGGPAVNAAMGHALESLGRMRMGQALIAGDALRIDGEAASHVDYEESSRAVASPPAGVVVGRATLTPPRLSPYSWSARRNGSNVTISGGTPSREVKARLANQAASLFPNAKIDDRQTLASGAPADFEAMAQGALTFVGGMSSGEIRLTDGQLDGHGQASAPAAYAAMERAKSALPAGMRLGSLTIEPPLIAPYRWSAKFDGMTLTLEGFAPDAATMDRLADGANSAYGASHVVNAMQLGKGADPEFARFAASALAQLRRLSEGSIALDGRNVTLKGVATPFEDANAAMQAFHSIAPHGYGLHATVTPSPEANLVAAKAAPVGGGEFSVTVTEDAATLAGVYGDAAAHKKLVALAQRLFSDKTVKDDMTEGEGGDRSAGVAETVLEIAARLKRGVASLSGRTVTASGETYYDKAAERIQEEGKAALPAGYALVAQLSPAAREADLAPDQCRDATLRRLARDRVNFDTAKASIQRDSYGLLDAIVATLERCSGAQIEVAGHTDGDGEAQANLELSQRRAQAVVEYLVRAGVSPTRLSAVGYGETMPIASNETSEGKAENRRIEFRLK